MGGGPFDYRGPGTGGPRENGQAEFDQFEATELYCTECRQPVPVRKFLLLVLPDGEKYEYRCQYCGMTVGDKIDRSGQFQGILST